MKDIDNSVTEALVAASVARAEGYFETSDAFLRIARQLQPAVQTLAKNAASTTTMLETNESKQ